MIEVVYTHDRESRECSLRVTGHAGQAEHGHDIVCASASILAYTIAQEMRNMKILGMLEDSPTIELDSGDATIVCKARNDKVYDQMERAFYLACVGYNLLEHSYPQYVKLDA